MKSVYTIQFLILLIVVAAVTSTSTAIFSHDGPGRYTYPSIRGHQVKIYGEGLYKDMSADVAPQGLAQDHVTLLIGIPLLIISFVKARKGSLKGRFLLAGTLGYFLVTYLFYLVMAMYNSMYPAYVVLLSASFFAFYLTMQSLRLSNLPQSFQAKTPTGFAGGFLVFNCIAIGLMWISLIIPPLLDGTIVPREVEHYTTLIVQGLDLALLLPAGFIVGVLFIRKKAAGYLFAPVYLIFLSLLMTALTAKLIAMAHLGSNVVPAIFIIPVFNLVAVICSVLVLKSVKEQRI